METPNGDQSNANQGTQSDGSAGSGTADSQPQEGQGGGESAGTPQGTSDQTGGEATPQGEKAHEQAIPYERFKAVNDELNQFKTLLESAKTDPAARSQLAEMFGVQAAPQPAQTPQSGVTPFQEFLQKSVDPQMHAHYDGFARAMASEWESHLEERLAPIMAFIGKTSLEGAYGKNPLLKEHERELAEVLKKHPTLSPDEAGWHIPALREKLVKQAAMSGQRKEQQRQQNMNRTPVTKSGGAPGATPQPAPKNIRGMFERNFDKLGSAPA